MKNIFLIIFLCNAIFSKAQTYPLRTYGIDFPKDSYVKDTNNELPSYEGTWKGVWNNKTIFITFKKIKLYLTHNFGKEYYKDILIAKFKVVDNSGNTLFDNTNISDNNTKIEGGGFKKSDGKYLFSYSDPELCFKNGFITIEFTDSNKNQIEWKFMESSNLIDTDCFYHGLPKEQRPEPLPKEIILTKQ